MAGRDFRIEVRQRDDGYELAVDSAAGDVTVAAEPPFDELALANRLLTLENALLRSSGGRRVVLTDDEREVQAFGQRLFEWLFRGDLRGTFDVSRSEARQSHDLLRIKLQIDSPTLARVPWEFLYDPGRGDYLALAKATPVVRTLESRQPIEPLEVTPPLRMLAMVASPNDRPTLDVQREHDRVSEATKELEAAGLLDVQWRPGTLRELDQALQDGPWHIFHFVGHGGFDRQRDEGVLALEGEGGATVLLYAKDLARKLDDHFPLRLVVLNACEGARGSDHDLFSSTAASIARLSTPAVVAMQYEITDHGAIEFSRSFYRAVADGQPVDVAMSAARQAMAANKTLEWGTPVLMMRASDGRIFDVDRAQAVARPVAPPTGPPDTPSQTPPDTPPPVTVVPPAVQPSRGSMAPWVAGGVTIALVVVVLIASILGSRSDPPSPPPTTTVTLAPGTPAPGTPDPLAAEEATLLAQVPAGLEPACRRTQGTSEQPSGGGEIVGLRCDRSGIGSNMYFLYDDPAPAMDAFLAGAATVQGGDCRSGTSGVMDVGRFRVWCRERFSERLGGWRAEMGWLDTDNLVYGRLNERRSSRSDIGALFAWWQRHAVLADVPRLEGGSQCEAVDWAVDHGVELVVAQGAGAQTGTVVSQSPAAGTQLGRDRSLVATVALGPFDRIVDVLGRVEDLARNLVGVQVRTEVRTAYTSMPQPDGPSLPGLVGGTVPAAESQVDPQSCVVLLMTGSDPAAGPSASAAPEASPVQPSPGASPAQPSPS